MRKRPPSSPELSSSSWGPEHRSQAGQLLLVLLRAYRLLLSPLLPAACRFTPSCSSFAIEAIERHGVAHGLLLTLGRILRCHPWHPGGYDPVPSARS